MAINRFLGTALKVAQVNTVTVGGTLAGETFEISVGGEIIAAHTDTDTVIATTVAALVAAWNSSANPWATRITAVDASPDIVLTADVLGCPFEITLNTPGGIATFVDVATTKNAGPNVISTVANWSTGSLPAPGEDIVFDTVGINILWDHESALFTPGPVASIVMSQRFVASSKVGLDPGVFVISADGETTDPTKNDYRYPYLHIVGVTRVEIGKQTHPLFPSVAGRIRLILGGAQIIDIWKTPASSADLGKSSVRLDGAGSFEINVHNADGGVSFGAETPGAAFTCATIWIGPNVGSGKVFVGSEDLTISNKLEVFSGDVQMSDRSEDTFPLVKVHGGNFRTIGAFLITAYTQDGGVAKLSHRNKTASDAVTTVNFNGGTLDGSEYPASRTWVNVNVAKGTKLIGNEDVLTITNLNLPSIKHTMEIK